MVSAIIVAAGAGHRLRYNTNKVFYPINGKPVLWYTIRQTIASKTVTEIIIVAAAGEVAAIRRISDSFSTEKPIRIVIGGKERQDSVFAGLQAVAAKADIVAIHDGARPLARAELFDDAVQALKNCDGVIYGVAVKDTIKQVDRQSAVTATIDRSTLRAIQTPQVFPKQLLLDGYAMARKKGRIVTDDAMLVEFMGKKVIVLPGDYRNIKLTTVEDIVPIKAYMGCSRTMRIGFGYDTHRLVEGRKLILGGVEIPYYLGLLGHSDADVLIHAVMDALLGAAGLRDIGTYFPDNDDLLKNISSILLLGRVKDILEKNGYKAHNIDVTLIADKPKIMPYVPEMCLNIRRALGIAEADVSVKATTNEGLGFIGREEGMVAQAVATIVSREEL